MGRARGIHGILAALIAAAMLVTACGATSPATGHATSTSATAQATGTASTSATAVSSVSVAVSTTSGQHYDPLYICCGSQQSSLPWILMGLGRFDSAGNMVPWLAKSWTANSNCTTWTIQLQPGAKWTDGQPVTAYDVLWTWEMYMGPWLFGKGAAQSKQVPIEGVAAFNAGQTQTLSGVKVVNPTTLVVSLTRPDCVLPDSLFWEMGILPQHVFKGVPHAQLANQPFLDKPIVSDGPYKFVVFQRNEYIEVHRWSGWWGNSVFGTPKIQTVFFKQLSTNDSVVQLLNGELDVSPVPGNELATFKKDKNVRVTVVPNQGITFYWFNMRQPAMQNRLVREAIDYALNKSAMLKTLAYGLGLPAATSIVGPKWAVDPSLTPRPYDPAKAKQLLKQAGWNPNTVLTYQIVGTSQTNRAYGLVFQQYMAKVGVKVKLATAESSQIIATFNTGNFDVTENGGGQFALDPSVSCDSYFESTTYYASKWMGYKDPALDTACAKGESVTSTLLRAPYYFQVQKLLYHDLPWLVLWRREAVFVSSKRLQGYTPSADGGVHDATSLLHWSLSKSS